RMRDRADDAGARFPADHRHQADKSDQGGSDVDAHPNEHHHQQGNDAGDPDRLVAEFDHGLVSPLPESACRTPASAASSSARRFTSAISGTAIGVAPRFRNTRPEPSRSTTRRSHSNMKASETSIFDGHQGYCASIVESPYS